MKRRGAPRATSPRRRRCPRSQRRRRGPGRAARGPPASSAASVLSGPRRTRRGRRRRRPGPRGRSPRSRRPRRPSATSGAPHVTHFVSLATTRKPPSSSLAAATARTDLPETRTPCGRPRFVPATVALLIFVATSSTTSSAPTTPQATSSHTPDTETWSGCIDARWGASSSTSKVARFPSRPKECSTYRRTGRPARRSWRGRRRARGARRLQ